MHSIKIPDTCQEITVGSVVILSRFPDTKWVLQDGWYMYEGQQYNGWYFSSIPAQTILPLQGTDLLGLVIVSGGSCGPIPHPPCPCPGPTPSPTQPRSVEKYMQGVNYVEGQLVWLETGVIYQVVSDFRSSSTSESVSEDLKLDVTAGKLIPISSDITSVGSISLYINFKEVFGKDKPEKSDADAYLATFDPQIVPSDGIQFVNSDTTASTFGTVYQYMKVPSSDELVFQAILGLKGDTGPEGPQGEPGDDGKSAYQCWLDAGNTGSEENFLNSLKGKDGEPGKDGINGTDGTDGQDGQPGKSAYEIAVDAGYEGSKESWLASLRGEQGPQGIQGEQGIQGPQGIEGASGSDGLSAYEVARKNGYDGSEAEWLSSLKGATGETGPQGPKGDTGDSGSKGDTGETGPQGEPGSDGVSITNAVVNDSGHLIISLSNDQTLDAGYVKGTDGTSINIKGDLDSTSELPSSGQQLGDCYLISGDLWVYTNSTESGSINGFKNAGTIQGPAGKGISSVAVNSSGQLVVTYSDSTTDNLGKVVGDNGKSAYQIAVDGGYDGSESDWIASLKGEKGDSGDKGPQGDPGTDGKNGDNGQSAYQIWLSLGNTGTESDFIASLKGEQGIQGVQGKQGIQGEQGIQGVQGQPGESGADGRSIVKVEFKSSSAGSSAGIAGATDTYEITYSDNTTSEFSIKNGENGPQGVPGSDGPSGVGISSVAFTSSTGGDEAGIAGATDTYTITFTDGKIATFVVHNGADGGGSIIIDSEMSDTSDNTVKNKVIKKYVDDIVGNIQSVLSTLVEVTE